MAMTTKSKYIVNFTYYDFHKFRLEVGIQDIYKLRPLGILPDHARVFYPNRLAELQDFCKENDEYHILSWMADGTRINSVRLGATFYYLCNGNPDPRLKCKDHLLWVVFETV